MLDGAHASLAADPRAKMKGSFLSPMDLANIPR